ncbi:MAG: D-alanine--D-alanine ligase family protein [Pseudomonadales bacterium]
MTEIRKFQLVIISGGDSSEAAVSRTSAQAVAEALEPQYPDLINLELSGNIVDQLIKAKPDVVFPVLHGPPGEDGTVQGLLEMLRIPYVGSDVHGSAMAMDKLAAKGLFGNSGLPMARHAVLRREDYHEDQLSEISAQLGAEVVVKPVRQGSALGVTRISNSEKLSDAVNLGFKFDAQLMIEARVNGREMTVGVLEQAGEAEAFPVIEIKTPEHSWYDYEHRYAANGSQHVMPAPISSALSEQLQRVALAAHQCLGCRDLSRADFIVRDDGTFVLLEVNTMPGMTPTSLYPDGAKGLGYRFDEVLDRLVLQAYSRKAR